MALAQAAASPPELLADAGLDSNRTSAGCAAWRPPSFDNLSREHQSCTGVSRALDLKSPCQRFDFGSTLSDCTLKSESSSSGCSRRDDSGTVTTECDAQKSGRLSLVGAMVASLPSSAEKLAGQRKCFRTGCTREVDGAQPQSQLYCSEACERESTAGESQMSRPQCRRAGCFKRTTRFKYSYCSPHCEEQDRKPKCMRAGCPEPAFNHHLRIRAYCSKYCMAHAWEPKCARVGCSRPSQNKKLGEFCCAVCRTWQRCRDVRGETRIASTQQLLNGQATEKGGQLGNE